MDNLDWAGAVQDISAAADQLAEGGNGSVGVVGFCMGGALSLASAALVDESTPRLSMACTPFCVRTVCFCGPYSSGNIPLFLTVRCAVVDCAVAFYGIPDPALADMSTLNKPVLGHFGDKDLMDGFSDPAAADALEAALTAAGSAHTIHRYPGVGHVRAILQIVLHTGPLLSTLPRWSTHPRFCTRHERGKRFEALCSVSRVAVMHVFACTRGGWVRARTCMRVRVHMHVYAPMYVRVCTCVLAYACLRLRVCAGFHERYRDSDCAKRGARPDRG